MQLSGNIKLALAHLRSARWRSFLTMLGIIIGVASVVITVSIGQGVKQEISKQINQLGPNLITVRPGVLVTRDKDDKITGVNYFTNVNSAAFSEVDWNTIAKSESVATTVPFNIVQGAAKVDNRTMTSSFIVGTTTDLPTLLNQNLEYGNFFTEEENDKNVVVIGKRVAEQLFQEIAPIGKSVQVRGQPFVVRGVFEEFPGSPIIASVDYNTAIFMPYPSSKSLSNGQVQIYQVLAESKEEKTVNTSTSSIRRNLRALHGGEEDFTVLKEDENLAVVNATLNSLTVFIAMVAAMSLFVGGVGIMNIMLVLVSERTREIGVRKAIGATNRQIMMQFLIEASVVSLVGGFIGVLISLLANYLIRIFTDFKTCYYTTCDVYFDWCGSRCWNYFWHNASSSGCSKRPYRSA